MKELLLKLDRHRRESDIRLVLFNIIDVAGFIGGTIAMIISYMVGLPFVQVVAIFGAVVVLAVSFYVANFRKNVNIAAFSIVFVISLILFPFMFYTDGGLYGGMGYWFLLGIIFNFLLIEGIPFYVLLFLQIALIVFCFIHTFYHPETVIGLEVGAMFVDVVQSLIITSLITGLIVRFQNNVYKDKLKELYEMNEEKERLAKVAADANRAKSNFLAQMSHEIRTPINAVLGMNEMILRRSDDNEILDYAESIDSAGNTLLALINSILDFSKIEDGKMDIIPVRYDTASFIHGLYYSIIQRADAKGLELVFDVDETLPCSLVGDNVRFSQIIMNLLTNAVKYTEKGKVVFSMRAQEKEGDEVKMLVSVSDTGIGIREKDINRLFESFERLDKVRNHSIEGTGLGISIVTSLLSMMGSRLQVESKYGEGSRFYFVIAQKIADETPIGDYEKRVKEAGLHKSKKEAINAPYAKVLLVDDNNMNLKVARNFLRLCGIQPDMVSSGADAIEKMRDKEYDIVFLDHMMPGMDGIETLQKLKSEELIPETTTVVALTANAVVGARETYLAAGFRDYLSKPMELKDLEEKLYEYLPEEAFGVKKGKEAEDEVMEFLPVEEGDSDSLDGDPGFNGDVDLSGDDSGYSGYSLDQLSAEGIDITSGLNYCAQDEDFYFEVIGDFVSSVDSRLEKLDGLLNDENLKEYEVEVHALKSNLRTIGAQDCFEEARRLEEAATDKDDAYIKAHHDELAKNVIDLRDKIKKTQSKI